MYNIIVDMGFVNSNVTKLPSSVSSDICDMNQSNCIQL